MISNSWRITKHRRGRGGKEKEMKGRDWESGSREEGDIEEVGEDKKGGSDREKKMREQ
jgi:hypothetical protein